MTDILIFAMLGGLIIWFIKLSVFSKPFPYPLSVLKQYRLGQILTKLSSVMEAVEQIRYTQRIGMRGSIESLPPRQKAKALYDFKISMVELSKFEPEVVTYATLGHIETSLSLNRKIRAAGQSRMLDLLVEEGLAVPADTFG